MRNKPLKRVMSYAGRQSRITHMKVWEGIEYWLPVSSFIHVQIFFSQVLYCKIILSGALFSNWVQKDLSCNAILLVAKQKRQKWPAPLKHSVKPPTKWLPRLLSKMLATVPFTVPKSEPKSMPSSSRHFKSAEIWRQHLHHIHIHTFLCIVAQAAWCQFCYALQAASSLGQNKPPAAYASLWLLLWGSLPQRHLGTTRSANHVD